MANDIYFGSGRNRGSKNPPPPAAASPGEPVSITKKEEPQPISEAVKEHPVYYSGVRSYDKPVTEPAREKNVSAAEPKTSTAAASQDVRSGNGGPVYYSGRRSPITHTINSDSLKTSVQSRSRYTSPKEPVRYSRDTYVSAADRNPTAYKGGDIAFGDAAPAGTGSSSGTRSAYVPITYSGRSPETAAKAEAEKTEAAAAARRRDYVPTSYQPEKSRNRTSAGASPVPPEAKSKNEPAPSVQRPAPPVTERIEDDLLHRPPTQLPYTFVDVDESYGVSVSYGTDYHEPTDEEREQRKKQRMKEAKKYIRKEARKKSRLPFILRTAACVCLALVILFVSTCAVALSGYTPSELSENEYISDSSLMYSGSVYNLLLMGIDTQDTHASSRSDSMILLSVDSGHSVIKTTSFMRDMYVSIPGHGDAKLNAACTYGGPQLVCDTIEYNFGIRIDGYIKIGYEVLTALVDGIGGIIIPEVDDTEAAALAEEGYNAPVGENIKMNGFEALQYCRIRHGQDDFYRTARQREVFGIIAKKLRRTNPLKLAFLAGKLIKMAECSVSKAQLITIALRFLRSLSDENSSARIPADGTWYDDYRNGQAVLITDLAANNEFLGRFIYENNTTE